MKKGFTLIELLAVIIILAVIALIATPLVLDVVDDARSGARKNSIFGYAEAVKLGVYEHQFKNNGANPTIDEAWLTTNVVTKGDTVTCEKVTFHETKGVLLSECTVGSDDTLYYYDGSNVLTEKPTGFDDYFTTTTPNITYKCKRAEAGTLHQETCSQTDPTYYCSGAGYLSGTAKGTTIEYGKLGTMGEDLESGDALDCDVNGDDIFDPVTERFYYVSSLYDTTEKEFNDEYAVLVYYINTSTSYAAYNSTGYNYNGPVTAAPRLPNVQTWTNVSLTSTTRQILNEQGGTTTSSSTLGTFDYVNTNGVDNAARMLTYNELLAACGEEGATGRGYLDTKCEYLMENTKFSSSSNASYGPWLETVDASIDTFVFQINSSGRAVGTNSAGNLTGVGVRPVIEVKYTDILH